MTPDEKKKIREQLQQVMQNPSALRKRKPHQKKHVVPEDYTDFASFFSLCDKAADWDVDATAKYQNKKIQGLINSLQGKVDAAIENLKKYKEIYHETTS